MTARAKLWAPLGVAILVVAVVLGAVFLRSDGRSGTPKRLPISLAAGGGGERATDSAAGGAAPSAGSVYGGVRYVLPSDLPDTPDDAPAYQLTGGSADAGRVRALATALGVDGEPVHGDAGWTVTDGDRTLIVTDGTGLPWYLQLGRPCAGAPGAGTSSGGPDTPVGGPVSDGAADDIAPCAVKGVPGVVAPVAPASDLPLTAAPSAGDENPTSDSGDPPTAGCDETSKTCVAPEPAPGDSCSSSESCSGGGSTGSGGSGTPEECTPEYCTDNSGSGTVRPGGVYCKPAPAGAEPFCASAKPEPQPSLPPEADARAAAGKVLDALQLTGATIRVQREWDTWGVDADPKVGGVDTVGWTTHLSIDQQLHVRYASGSLAAAELADRYPVLTPKAAFDRMQQTMPRIAIDCDAKTPECGAGEPKDLVVSNLRLGLAFAPGLTRGGGAYLVPAWLFEAGDTTPAFTQFAIALPEEFMTSPSAGPTEGTVTAEPATEGPNSDPGGVPGEKPAAPPTD
jgi:hypothetical protein